MIETTQSIDERVIDFVAESTGIGRSKITRSTTLFGDLSMDGDDAEEFPQAYAKHFEVDLAGLNFNDHFGTEGISPFQIPRFVLILIRTIRGTNPHEAAGMIPITIEDLIRAAATKKWISLGR